MSSYLEIAVAVLRSKRRPLSARAILTEAYRTNIVPTNLYGRTQHKTLQARISEDIVAHGEKSSFFRTQPGRFFLSEFLTDTSIPEDLRVPIPTRRRSRELARGPALALNLNEVKLVAKENEAIDPAVVFGLLRREAEPYGDPRDVASSRVFLKVFVCVWRQSSVLSYRVGRYRDDRDHFMSRKSIGFSSLIQADSCNLFTQHDFGIVDSGMRAVTIDLNIEREIESEDSANKEACIEYFVLTEQAEGEYDLLAVVHYDCPEWFEPTRRRLALNDLGWLDLKKKINDMDDFDPWSRSVLLLSGEVNIMQSV